ncbi:MAG: AmmeMemoRadiSam system radical SAM enzyme [Candidatus Cloacimonadaceae bacterium]|jgi:pyruvate formate lyase activating enzyme|nr:AmmeMemoRadiSam system radical SAM enzyme [Candidatus Cloacimonadota bacterium]MDX9949602.1 AmmeMemoRadiSam system radical SAM enzyme [Candidatus Syntrophosphaera sp.]
MNDFDIRECMHYQKLEGMGVRCVLCPHLCLLKVGEIGLCRGRQNQDGKLIAVNYGKSIGLAVDPIEKKPLYHFRPGTSILSLGPNSCNLNCFYCQNYNSSQQESPTMDISPRQLRDLIRERGLTPQVAFTYTEPLTWFEYIYDFAQIAPEVDIVLVSNGFINPEPLEQLLPFVKAMNIDLKFMRDQFYKEHCGASLDVTLRTIKKAHTRGVHLELTNLLIPGLNDSEEDILDLVKFVGDLDRRIPLHFSAYHPAYKSQIPATPITTVLKACRMASDFLDYVYAGNIGVNDFSATKCPGCGKEIITTSRRAVGLDGAFCKNCGHKINGVF